MPTVAIKPGATVFVTGVNGLIGSYIVDKLLTLGYHVKGAVRNVEGSKWLKDYFDVKYEGQDVKFELVSVPDMTIEGCYGEVVKETEGFIHVASPLNGDDPAVVIPTAVNGALNALKAAAKTPSIKSVVYTSSSLATCIPRPNIEYEINDQSWNEEGLEKGWQQPNNEPAYMKGLYIYCAIKTEAEKACWKWVRENNPGFNFSTICPNANYSALLVPEKQGAPSTIAWIKSAFIGEGFDHLRSVITPQYYISTQDTALIHISALIHGDVKGERLLAFAEPFNWNKILGIFRKLYPERSFAGNKDEGEDLSTVRNERAKEVLSWVKDSGEWDLLENSLREVAAQWVHEGS